MCPGVGGAQHADTCVLNKETEKAVCACKEGYIGDHCDRCDKFYYGNPIDKDVGCKRCDCNGNNDENSELSCDVSTGKCQNCLHNTDGNNCEKCKYGFYGSAKSHKCYECNCDPRGTVGHTTQNCDNITGQCKCLQNIQGLNCDKPDETFYWSPDNNGTMSCNCDTTGTQNGESVCNVLTGECFCKTDRGGRTCNECAERTWGNPKDGCKDCKCHGPGSDSSLCDKQTGECICKRGVTGKNCDQCARGTKGSVPKCEPCGFKK